MTKRTVDFNAARRPYRTVYRCSAGFIWTCRTCGEQIEGVDVEDQINAHKHIAGEAGDRELEAAP